MSHEINETLARKVLEVVDKGLISGLGQPIPGQMCVEAAVCFAMGLPHGDDPPCVSDPVCSLKICLNDSQWSSSEARAKGMRRLAVAQLGTAESFDDNEFGRRVAEAAVKKIVPIALRRAAEAHPDESHKLDLRHAAAMCEQFGDISYALQITENARLACMTDTKAVSVLWDTYNIIDFAALAQDANILYNCIAFSDPIAGDQILSVFAEEVVQVLIEMKAPGTQWLGLTEADKS